MTGQPAWIWIKMLMMAIALCRLLERESAAQSPAMFVGSFNRLLSEKKTALGVDYTVEGRFSSTSSHLLRLKHCPISFRPAKGETFSKAAPDNRVAELFGQLQVLDGQTVFVVKRLRLLANDVDRYQLRKTTIRSNKPDDWYRLGKWASRRAAFYNDEELLARADEANSRGIDLERRNVPPDNPDRLLSLAKKAVELNLPDLIRSEYFHEACRMRWAQAQTEKKPKLQDLLEQMARDLAGCREQLRTPQPELERKYEADPLSVFQLADASVRRKLCRIFFRQVTLASILQGAKSDGSNGFDVAAKINQQLPEQHSLAERYRDRELSVKLSQVARLTRPEMLRLSEQFRRRNQPKQSRLTLKNWLLSIEQQFREEGPVGLMRAAEEYIELLEDESQAVRLLLEAYKLSPESKRVAEMLTRLGYRLKNGQWLAKDRVTVPKYFAEKAIRQGRVVAEMTSQQVRMTLGVPASITRVATSGQLSELWVYGERGTSRLVIYFLRRTPRSELKAVRISQIQPQQ